MVVSLVDRLSELICTEIVIQNPIAVTRGLAFFFSFFFVIFSEIYYISIVLITKKKRTRVSFSRLTVWHPGEGLACVHECSRHAE